MVNNRDKFGRKLIDNSDMLHVQLEGSASINRIAEYWVGDYGLNEPIEATIDNVADEVAEIMDGQLPFDSEEFNLSRSEFVNRLEKVVDWYIERYIIGDLEVELVMNGRLFVPFYLADAFRNGDYYYTTSFIENVMQTDVDTLLFFLKLFDDYEGTFDESDTDDILERFEQFDYSDDLEPEEVTSLIDGLVRVALSDIDAIGREFTVAEDASIELAHDYLDELLSDSDKLANEYMKYYY